MSSPGYRPTPAAASQLNLRGAVDLSSLRRPPAPPQPPVAAASPEPTENGEAAAGGPSLRVDATETNFQDLVQLSAQVPVLFLLWSRYAADSPGVLAAAQRVVESFGGRLVLAAADVDTFPQLAQAFQVQAVPTAVAVVKGQPVPLFQGPADDAQIKSLVEELLQVAAANGVTGSIGDGTQGAEAEPEPLPPLHQAAIHAIEAGDYAGAAAAYKQALLEQPADADAKAGLAQVELMARLEKLSAADAESLRELAAQEPDNVHAQLGVADLDLSGGHVEDGFNRIIAFIGRNFGQEREAARVRLLELFEVVGVSDERVAKARQGLARVLF
ncbi:MULTISPECIES: tetratricopeptide repeat protein [Paenarthrobacter]|uniref:Tetratricopeptide repeat protein n=1 Tax=Paenarthrobacter ureafaciens TaxID=37931 RepID=A0AAX3EE32_PAEUR|nr:MULTISPECIES: tetratricopeptide repeat protein [Paenarthrobacter]NKR13127.1 co-chaperone YbbN [Arthrobacter sp. M5]NKR15023.1 co-chaperone YbbN [Arthrobacter sp. M6]OEH62559.1 co-chaperone YbbN [Arthrobacter sp. D4]OEH63130.1 co-chaperone YbbN [Arthrobacter sp. D2]MDO5865330.1 tetratricopeptide repeat protein [Paenarthrobacter sp. SD-2]